MAKRKLKKNKPILTYDAQGHANGFTPAFEAFIADAVEDTLKRFEKLSQAEIEARLDEITRNAKL